jgi:hypothetical protein
MGVTGRAKIAGLRAQASEAQTLQAQPGDSATRAQLPGAVFLKAYGLRKTSGLVLQKA